MRTEIHDRQVDITALATQLASAASPGSELRQQKAGVLYAKSGPRHTDGKSRSRLIYQAGGAQYLGRSICLSLRQRHVQHVDALCKAVMDAARPSQDRRADEPDRYLVRHARVMARIIQMAECPGARPLGFEAALNRAIKNWPVLSGLDDKAAGQWWADAVRSHAAPARQDPEALPDAKAVRDLPKLPKLPQLTPMATPSSASALRETPVLWHAPAHDEGGADSKHGPKGSATAGQAGPRKDLLWVDTEAGKPIQRPISTTAVSSRPSLFATTQPPLHRRSPDSVVFHASPQKDAERAARRAEGYLDDLLSGVFGADYLLESVRRDDLPYLVPLMRKRMDSLMASAALRRDAKAQAQDWQAWHSLARFCGEACTDEGAGAHAFTRAQVLQFPLKHRLNLLAALDGPDPGRRQEGKDLTALAARDKMMQIQQQHGLMSAFTEAELLPPSDEVRAKAFKARLQAIGQQSPGATLTVGMARAVAQAHRDAYQVTGQPLNIVASPALDKPFEFSEDRRTLRISTAPRPAAERPAAVLRQLVAELTRDYQQQLIRQMNDETLQESDDRFMLAVILLACQPRAIDVEVLSGGMDRALPASALSRHAALHATLAAAPRGMDS